MHRSCRNPNRLYVQLVLWWRFACKTRVHATDSRARIKICAHFPYVVKSVPHYGRSLGRTNPADMAKQIRVHRQILWIPAHAAELLTISTPRSRLRPTKGLIALLYSKKKGERT